MFTWSRKASFWRLSACTRVSRSLSVAYRHTRPRSVHRRQEGLSPSHCTTGQPHAWRCCRPGCDLTRVLQLLQVSHAVRAMVARLRCSCVEACRAETGVGDGEQRRFFSGTFMSWSMAVCRVGAGRWQDQGRSEAQGALESCPDVSSGVLHLTCALTAGDVAPCPAAIDDSIGIVGQEQVRLAAVQGLALVSDATPRRP